MTETETDETQGVNPAHTPDDAENSAPKGVSISHTPEEGHETPTLDDQSSEETAIDEEPDTFPRSVVEKLRKENASYREKAKRAETYAKELFSARVAATGRLADPDDLTFDEALLEDHDALSAAVEELVARKPHLALRKPRGDVGAGALSSDGSSVDLAGILRSRV